MWVCVCSDVGPWRKDADAGSLFSSLVYFTSTSCKWRRRVGSVDGDQGDENGLRFIDVHTIFVGGGGVFLCILGQNQVHY